MSNLVGTFSAKCSPRNFLPLAGGSRSFHAAKDSALKAYKGGMTSDAEKKAHAQLAEFMTKGF